jgi:hypothetical protein
MDLTKSKSRGISCDMSPAAVERRLEIVDELRELALELSRAERLGPVESKLAVSKEPIAFKANFRNSEK